MFWPKAWVNPFEKKCDFLDFEKCCFLRSQKGSFFSAKTESIVSVLTVIKFR